MLPQVALPLVRGQGLCRGQRRLCEGELEGAGAEGQSRRPSSSHQPAQGVSESSSWRGSEAVPQACLLPSWGYKASSVRAASAARWKSTRCGSRNTKYAACSQPLLSYKSCLCMDLGQDRHAQVILQQQQQLISLRAALADADNRWTIART